MIAVLVRPEKLRLTKSLSSAALSATVPVPVPELDTAGTCCAPESAPAHDCCAAAVRPAPAAATATTATTTAPIRRIARPPSRVNAVTPAHA